MSTSTTASSDKGDVYEVLYWKSKNKKHKLKDVSKCDGLLTVQRATAKVSLRTVTDSSSSSEDDDDDEPKNNKKKTWKQRSASSSKSGVVYSGSLSSAQVAQLQQPFQDDDTLQLGTFQVQILGPLHNKKNQALSKPSNTGSSLLSKIMPGSAAALRRTLTVARRPRPPPPQPKKTTTPRMPQTTTLSPKPAQPVRPKTLLAPSTNRIRKTTSAASNGGGLIKRPFKSAISARPVKQHKSSIKQYKPSTISNSNDGNNTSSTILPHIPLPATIRSVLRPHQVEGVDFLWNAGGGAILADEMGLGKTLMSISVIAAKHRQSREKQFMVVCPSSLVSNWSKEFDKWLGPASQPKRVVITKGGEAGLQQIRAYCNGMKHVRANQMGQVLIISYDLFRRNSNHFQELHTSFALLVADEAHRLKNTAGSLTITALESIPSDARLLITATPVQNQLSEFYTLANFCRPGVLGDLTSFRRDFERHISASNTKNASREQQARGVQQSKALEAITQTFLLRRLQKDVLTSMLPPRTEALLFCRPSQRQCELYRNLVVDVTDALSTLTTLRKICSHPFLYQEESNHIEPSTAPSEAVALSGKLIVLDALLQSIRTTAPDDKVVIVSNFTSALSLIEALVLQPRAFSHLRLDGTTDLQTRQPLVDSFNRSSADRNFCFLLSSKAGGVGLNLVGANRLVMFDPDWNPALDIQAMGRVYRQGQTKPCFIYRLFTSGTVEEVVYQRQSLKGNLATMTVDGAAGQQQASSSSSRFTKQEIADCFTLKEGCDCDTKRKVGSRWPAYEGADSLQGCQDESLIRVAQCQPETLAFVHLVSESDEDDKKEAVQVDERKVAAELDLYNSSSEEECVF